MYSRLIPLFLIICIPAFSAIHHKEDLDAKIWAISSVDGRYRQKLEDLSSFVSEGALISFRIKVEAKWLLYLAEHSIIGKDLSLKPREVKLLKELASQPSQDAILQVKRIEKTTNHDVKAVEYYLRDA